jgi:hypothetical protein
MKDQYESTAIDYYYHPSNQLGLTSATLNVLVEKQHVLQSLYDARIQIYNYSTTRIKAVWEEFNIPILERPTLPLRLSDQDMIELQDIINNIDPLVRNVFDKYIQQVKFPFHLLKNGLFIYIYIYTKPTCYSLRIN